MLDPITAIGLASSIVAFVDYGYKVVKGAAEIYNGSDGALAENMTREAVVTQMMSLSTRLQSPDSSHMVGQDRALCVLAAECHKIASDLLRLFESLRPAKPSSRAHSLRASLMAKFKDAERRDLEKRLDGCRAQLALHLNFASMASVDKLAEHVRGHPESLAALQKQVAELSGLVCAMGLATQQQLIATQRRSVEKILCDSILERLAFWDLRHREDSIVEAHEDTFRWIFADTARSRHDSRLERHAAYAADQCASFLFPQEAQEAIATEAALRREEQGKLLHWLASGSGVFHISGKMGSGKSTLMKFLGAHDETRKRLTAWAGECELVMASFYFWRVGSPLQKSLAGLCRSLLYDVLKAHPDLIPDVFPDTWKTAVQASVAGQGRPAPEIREAEVRQAFSRLGSSVSRTTKHRFCFFIDGLDEYESAGSFDTADMAAQLNAWTSASGSIKFCVSSREHNEFMAAFASPQRLRLHDVTRLDIHLFVEDRLGAYRSLDGYARVRHSIVDRAHGVFLWVATVVQGVRVQLRNGVPPAMLSELITALPDELFQLYEHIIASMDKYTRRRLVQTLAMLEVGQHRSTMPHSFHVRMYYFLGDYNTNENFARETAFAARLHSLKDEVDAVDETARRRVAGWCQGLVQVTSAGHIAYSHLSVPEFLNEKPDVLAECRAAAGSRILSELNLAHFKLNAARMDKDTQVHDFLETNLARMIQPLLAIRRTSNLDGPPFAFLQSVDDTLECIWPYLDFAAGNDGRPCSRLPGCPQALMDRVSYAYPKHAGSLSLLREWNVEAGPAYTAWKIENVPSATSTQTKIEVLFLSAFHRDGHITVPVLESLFRRRLVTHATPFGLFPNERVLGHYKMCMPTKRVSMWRYFLLHAILTQRRRAVSDDFYRTMALFLQSGADPRLWVAATRPAQKQTIHQDFVHPRMFQLVADAKLPTGPEGLYIWITGYWYHVCVSAHPPGGCSRFETLPADKDGSYAADDEVDFSMPVRAWVDQLPGSPEKTHCLALIDQRIRALASPATASVGGAYTLAALLLLCLFFAWHWGAGLSRC